MDAPLFLALPSKRSSKQGTKIAECFVSAITREHGRKSAKECLAACERFGKLRDDATANESVTTVYEFDARKDYVNALSYVLDESSHAPSLSSAQRPVSTVWCDAFNVSDTCSSANLTLDRVGALFNVAAGHGDLAARGLRGIVDPTAFADALKACGSHYNRAAGIFQALSKERSLVVDEGSKRTPDVTTSAFLALENAMRANAMMATYQVTVISPDIGDKQCATIAGGVRDLLASVVQHTNAPELEGSSVLRRVGLPAAVLKEAYDAEAHLRAELATPEMDMSVRLTRMREAVAAISRANQMLASLDETDPLTTALRANLQLRTGLIEERSSEVNGENTRIYMVYENSVSVPPVQGRTMGRPMAFAEDGEAADDVVRQFERLAPRPLSELAEQYEVLSKEKADSEKRLVSESADALREAVGRAETAALEAEGLVSSAHVACSSDARASTPNVENEAQALATVRAAVDQGGYGRLQELRREVEGLALNAESSLDKIRESLTKEAGEDEQLRREAAVYGISRADSTGLTADHVTKLQHIREVILKAQKADAYIDSQLQSHSTALRALGNIDLSSVVPGVAAKQAEAERAAVSARAESTKLKVSELRKSIGAAKSLFGEESSVVEQLDNHLATDDIETTARTESKTSDVREEASKLIDSKYGAVVARAAAFTDRAATLQAQLDEVAVLAVETGRECKTSWGGNPSRDPMMIVWNHLASAKKFQELLQNLQEGTNFWLGESDAISLLQKDVDGFILSRNLQAVDIRGDIETRRRNNEAPPQAYPPPPQSGAPHGYSPYYDQQQHHATSSNSSSPYSQQTGPQDPQGSYRRYVRTEPAQTASSGASQWGYNSAQGAGVPQENTFSATPAGQPRSGLPFYMTPGQHPGGYYGSTPGRHGPPHGGQGYPYEQYQSHYLQQPTPAPPPPGPPPGGPPPPPPQGPPPPPPGPPPTGPSGGSGRIGAWGRR